MTLKIKVHDICEEGAAEMVKACTEMMKKIRSSDDNIGRSSTIEFEYGKTEPTVAYRGEDTPFTRYINGAPSTNARRKV